MKIKNIFEPEYSQQIKNYSLILSNRDLLNFTVGDSLYNDASKLSLSVTVSKAMEVVREVLMRPESVRRYALSPTILDWLWQCYLLLARREEKDLTSLLDCHCAMILYQRLQEKKPVGYSKVIASIHNQLHEDVDEVGFQEVLKRFIWEASNYISLLDCRIFNRPLISQSTQAQVHYRSIEISELLELLIEGILSPDYKSSQAADSILLERLSEAFQRRKPKPGIAGLRWQIAEQLEKWFEHFNQEEVGERLNQIALVWTKRKIEEEREAAEQIRINKEKDREREAAEREHLKKELQIANAISFNCKELQQLYGTAVELRFFRLPNGCLLDKLNNIIWLGYSKILDRSSNKYTTLRIEPNKPCIISSENANEIIKKLNERNFFGHTNWEIPKNADFHFIKNSSFFKSHFKLGDKESFLTRNRVMSMSIPNKIEINFSAKEDKDVFWENKSHALFMIIRRITID